jgi:hypothetical protein
VLGISGTWTKAFLIRGMLEVWVKLWDFNSINLPFIALLL